MKDYNLVMNKYVLFLICFLFFNNCSFAISTEELLQKAQITSNEDESYEYINSARKIYEEEYNKNPNNTDNLLGLSKTYQLMKDRSKAKLYVLLAYNTNPASPVFQKAMADFFYNFQEYSTAIEYYKLSLASGLLMDYETNLQTAKCYEKLGDTQNAGLYYKISGHINPKSKEAIKKVNSYESLRHPDNTEELENAKYKYLFKDRKKSEAEQIKQDTEEIIEQINSFY